jgi:hypothetical protein
LLALQGIFIAAAVFAAGMTPSVFFIREEQVDYEAARGGDTQQKQRSGWRDLAGDKRILTFTGCVVLYYFANAATLPLVGEILSQGKKGQSSAWQVAAMVIVAESAMIWRRHPGRKIGRSMRPQTSLPDRFRCAGPPQRAHRCESQRLLLDLIASLGWRRDGSLRSLADPRYCRPRQRDRTL